ncbi:ABC transporter permease [Nocardioides sp.]|uniref:ABC transporter permease n=1 Tax=Nocardioides sp. TaxID=35761 RepID=UPI0039E4E02B
MTAPRAGVLRSALGTSWGLRSGVVLIAISVLVAIFAPLIAPHSPVEPNALHVIENPSRTYLLGTDQLGRDVLTRVLYGGRFALVISLCATVMIVVLGTFLGCLAAYRRGWFDQVLARLIDTLLAIPAILGLLVVVTVLGAGMPIIVLVSTVIYLPASTRVLRASAQTVVDLDYVTAARARGERFWPILRRELWPNILDVVMVELAVRASSILLLVSALSFLGFGANPPTPDWGLMVSENRALLAVAPWATIAPIIALAFIILGLNLAADGFAKARGVDRGVAR